VRRLTEAVQGEPLRFSGGCSIDEWCTARDVLIVANGPEARLKKSEIEMFIRQHQPFVIGLNAHLPVDISLVDAVAVCHPERAVLDASALANLECEVVMPSELSQSLGLSLKRHRDLGMFVTNSQFDSSPAGVGIPDPLVIGYVLAAVTEGRAKRIYLVGVDGYSAKDPRQISVQHTLDRYRESRSALPIVALTKTSLSVEQRSLFAPL